MSDDDRRQRLVALRDLLTETIAEAEPQHRAALAKQLRETLADLADLEPEREGDELDELKGRRQAKAEVPQPPATRRKRRSTGG